MLSEKLKQAISLVKAGDKLAAQKLLVEILNDEPANETAWLWFTDTLNSDSDKKVALEGLLKINPNSQAAKLGLQRLADRGPMPEEKGIVEDDRAEVLEPNYLPVEMDQNDEKGFPVETDEVEPGESHVAETAPADYMPAEHDGAPEGSEAITTGTPPTAPANPEPVPAAPGITPAAGPGASVATTPEPYTTPEAAAPTAAANAPRKFSLSPGIAKMVLILGALAILGVAVYFFADMLGLFAPSQTACVCTNTDAYLLRVQDRVSRWMNNQALYVFAESHGDAPQNTDFAQQLLDEENKDTVPVCLNDLHQTLLTTFENHIKYGTALQNKDTQQIAYYRSIEAAMQDNLKQDFESLKTTLKCTP